MSTSQWPNAVDEQEILEQTRLSQERDAKFKSGATPELAQRVSQIYRDNPWMKPGEVLALAKGGASDNAVQRASDLSATATKTRLDPDSQPKGWWTRNVAEPFKATSRWTFAALNLAPELTTNVASKFFSGNSPDTWDGWFKSTTLGSLMSDPGNAGEGFFAGGSVAEKQSERARRFRGTINGQAWTVGRGAANLVFTPGSKEYNFLSGVVDAAVNVFADPTMPVGKALAGARAAKAVIPGLQTAEEVSAFAKIAERGLAGLEEAEKIAWNGSKFRSFFMKDPRAIRLTNAVAENSDAFDIMSRIFDYKIDIDTAKQLAATKNADEVIALIGGAANRLDSSIAGILPSDIREIRGATKSTFLKERVPGYNSWRNSRLLTDVPNQVLIAGSNQDRIRAVKSYANYLDTVGIKSTSDEGRAFMTQVMDAYSAPTEVALTKVNEVFENMVTKLMVREYGAARGKEISKDMFTKVRQTVDATKRHLIDEAGEMFDGNIAKTLVDSGLADLPDEIAPGMMDRWVMSGPASTIELIDSVQMLPDFRTVRRLTSPFFKRALNNKFSEGALAATEYLQNEIWKPLTLATGGYIVRNMFDAQLRMATIGKANIFTHPFEYIMYVINKKAPSNIYGRKWDEFMQKSIDELDGDVDKFVENMSFGLQRNLIDPVQASKRAVRTGSYKTVNRASEPDLWLRGLIDELRQISQDVISNGVAKGVPDKDILAYLRDPNRPKGVEALESLKKYLQGGVPIRNKDTGAVAYLQVKDVNDQVLQEWINRLSKNSIAMKTGGNQELAFALGYRRIPNGARSSLDPNDLLPGNILDGPKTPGVGSLIEVPLEPGVQAIVTDVGDGTRWTIQRVSNNDIWDSEEGLQEFTAYVKNLADDPAANLPRNVKFAEREVVKTGLRQTEDAAISAKNRFVDFFFNNIYGKAVQTFERSPLYRQFYYDNIINNADLLSKDEAATLLSRLRDSAARNEVSIQDLVGGKKNFQRLEEALARSTGSGTMEQLDEYASVVALNKVKDSLYNAAERNNVEDILRILMPFGSAYREVMTTYLGYLAENPARIRRAQQVYTGLTNADPDNDGQGFFYKDPVTGENMFVLPFSGTLSKLITGVESPLVGRVKGLSMGFQVIPSIGPVAQIAASQIIPDTPKTDEIVEILLPFGRKGLGAFVPGYVNKFRDAIQANPGKLESIYGNTYMEMVQAMSATGEYDLNDPEEKLRLFDDSRWRARIMTGLRALSQFLGPTTGTTEFIVDTKEGDVMASALTAEFFKLQRENYSTAVQRFMERFGDDALLYISSKTRAQTGGLSASDQFGDWERSNGDLFKKYPLAAAYFAPAGDDFSFAVYERQLRQGKRKRLTDEEMVDLAQYRIGAAIYRDLKNQLGRYPTQEQRDWLATQRRKISEKYPGFPAQSVYTVGEFERTVAQIKQAADDPKLQNNETAQAVRTYLQYRDQAYQQVFAEGNKSLEGKKFTELRSWLYNIGETISQQYPNFSRVWDELSSEVD